MKNDKKSQLEAEIEKASKTGKNILEIGIGFGMVTSTLIFSNFNPFPYYKPIVDITGFLIFAHGVDSIKYKFKYLSKTCKDLHQEIQKKEKILTDLYKIK